MRPWAETLFHVYFFVHLSTTHIMSVFYVLPRQQLRHLVIFITKQNKYRYVYIAVYIKVIYSYTYLRKKRSITIN